MLSELPGGTFGGKLPPKTGQWPVPPTTPPTTAPTMEVAQAWNEPAGFVLDYLQLNVGETDFTFYDGTTYYVSGEVSLGGTTTLQGGAVIKYGNSDGLILLDMSAGAFVCDTTPDNVAIFTAIDDNSVGEIIEGSSGNPSGFYGDWAALYAYGDATLHDVQFHYLHYVIWAPGTCTITNAQFINCASVVAAPQIYCTLKNVLISGCGIALDCYEGTLQAENATFHQLGGLANEAVTACLTNCLVVAVADTGLASLSGVNNVFLSSDVEVFRSFGTGSHYLPVNSPLINAGSGTSYDVGLQNYTTQVGQAVEGSSTVDIGYHYYPIPGFDGDNDGMLDAWEIQYFWNLTQTPTGDYDGDGVSNLEEFQLGRNPTVRADADTTGVTGLKVYTPLK